MNSHLIKEVIEKFPLNSSIRNKKTNNVGVVIDNNYADC